MLSFSCFSLKDTLKGRVEENSEQFELQIPNSPKIIPNSFTHGRPDLLCEPGHVFTVNRLCGKYYITLN